jgi:cobyrinic acid a,c-diamide synthase
MITQFSDTPGFVLAAQSSGIGKTTIAAALCTALSRSGHFVQPFKTGPDFVDPTYLTLASGRQCVNLDGFPNPELIPFFYSERCRARQGCPRADIAVVEGVMGLYDGLGPDGVYSTAWTARELGLPVILLVDARAAATSVAAVARGFATLEPLAPEIVGVIANRVSGEAHANLISDALARFAGIPLLGWLPNLRGLTLSSRHLGLIPALERRETGEILDSLASLVEESVNIKEIVSRARVPKGRYLEPDILTRLPLPREGRPSRVAVARDNAFCFHYAENWELLRALGCEVLFTSPLCDDSIPPLTDLLILPGGYPEEFADSLSENAGYIESVREFAHRGRIYAECGGMMYLTRGIEYNGRRVPMAGIIDAEAFMTTALRRFGYVEASVSRDNIMFRRGERFKAHEFHYSETRGAVSDVFSVRRASRENDVWTDGFTDREATNLLATYMHINFWSCPDAARRVVKFARIAADIS